MTSQNKYLLVELVNYNSKLSVTIAITILDVYVIGYKSGSNSFFLKDAPSDAKTLLFDGTTKKTLSVDTNYEHLGYRDKVGLGIPPLEKAIDILNGFDGISTDQAFRNSLLIVIQMVAEAARFKFIQLKIQSGIDTSYLPRNDTLSFENNWDDLSERIQKSGTNGVFKTLTLLNDDGTDKNVSTVEQVKGDISLLKYHASGETLEETNFGGVYYADEAVKEELLSVL